MRPSLILRDPWIALIVLIFAPVPAYSANRNVVMLFDERPEFPGLAALDAEFTRTLIATSKDQFELYRESMDLSRFGSKTYEIFLRDSLGTKFARRKIDAVVAFLGPALDFVLSYGQEIFPGAPIVFCGVSASIAHEVRQSLTAISAAGEAGLILLDGRTPNIGEAREALKAIVEDSHRADHVPRSGHIQDRSQPR